jgi:putative aldouronate transport system permease protein
MLAGRTQVGIARKKGWMLFTMMIPGVVYLLFNNYLPMAGVIIAFKNINYTKGILGSPWVGLKNFEYLFRTTDAFIITRNTLLYNISFIVINLIISITLALLLNEVAHKTLTRFFQSVVLLPYLISMVIVGYLVFAMLSAENGFINHSILPILGMKEIIWYAEPKYWPVILTLVNIWKQGGYLCVIYYAAIIGLDKGLYEAAELDGAGKLRQIWHITLPQIKQVIVTMTLLQIGRIFYSDFGLFFQVTLDTGSLMPTTNVIDTYVYRALMNLGDISMSSAAGVYQSLVGFILVLASNRLVRKIDSENALF